MELTDKSKQIIKLYRKYEKQNVLARKYNITPQRVHTIIYTHLSITEINEIRKHQQIETLKKYFDKFDI